MATSGLAASRKDANGRRGVRSKIVEQVLAHKIPDRHAVGHGGFASLGAGALKLPGNRAVFSSLLLKRRGKAPSPVETLSLGLVT
jgi:hypothetical protein